MLYNNDTVVVIGYSGHGFVVTDTAREALYQVKYYADKTVVDVNPFGLEYIGFDGDPEFEGWGKNFQFILGVGNNRQREIIAKGILSRNERLLTIVHPKAHVSSIAEIGDGTFISANVSVNALAKIGRYALLNTGCIVEHECSIGDSVHIAPGAVLAGNVAVGDRSFIGANAVIKQGITVGKDVIIGAGSVVLRNIPDGVTFVGNPAAEIK